MRPQIDALTSTRAFAAILVFIFHFGHYVVPFFQGQRFFYSGNIAVCYFFVLSGFVLYISYVDNKFTYWDFFKKRIARIVPVYLLALGLFMIVYLCIYKAGYNDTVTRQLVTSALFIQAYFPDYALKLNTAAWSLSVEMLFYLSFPFLLLLQRKNGRLFLALTATVYVITQTLFLIFFKGDFTQTDNWNFFLYNPIMHVNQFMIGMAGGYLFRNVDPSHKKFFMLPLILVCIIVLLIIYRPASISYEVGLISPVFMLFILFTAFNNPRFLNFRPFVFLGEISYGIYILQFPIRELLNGYAPLHQIFTEQYFFYFSLAMLILAAALSYYFIEKPLRRKITAIGSRKKKPVAIVAD